MGKTEAGQVHGKGPGFSSAKKSSSLRSENCYLLTFDFPRAPLYDGTSSLFPGGLHNYAAQHPGPFSPGQYFLELLDFQMRTVYSGSIISHPVEGHSTTRDTAETQRCTPESGPPLHITTNLQTRSGRKSVRMTAMGSWANPGLWKLCRMMDSSFFKN